MKFINALETYLKARERVEATLEINKTRNVPDSRWKEVHEDLKAAGDTLNRFFPNEVQITNRKA